MTMKVGCVYYNDLSKDTLYVFKACEKVREVWMLLFPQALPNGFFGLNLKEWLEQNLRWHSGEDAEIN